MKNENNKIWNVKQYNRFFGNHINRYICFVTLGIAITFCALGYIVYDNYYIKSNISEPTDELIQSPEKYFNSNKNEVFSINGSTAKMQFISEKQIKIVYKTKELPVIALYKKDIEPNPKETFIPIPHTLRVSPKIEKLSINGALVSEMRNKHMSYEDIAKNYFNTDEVVVNVFLK